MRKNDKKTGKLPFIQYVSFFMFIYLLSLYCEIWSKTENWNQKKVTKRQKIMKYVYKLVNLGSKSQS